MFPFQNTNTEIKLNPNLRSCQNLQTLISTKKNLEKITEFKIKLKKPKDLTISNKNFLNNSEESELAKTGSINFSLNNQRNEFSNTKTKISKDSTSRSITLKNGSMEENIYLEKAKRKLSINPKPSLGAFISSRHNKGFENEYWGSFADFNKFHNCEELRLNGKFKKIQSSNNMDLDCSLEKMISTDEDELKGCFFSLFEIIIKNEL